MSSYIPFLEFSKSSLYTGVLNDKGQLCNIYTPLQNLADEETKKLGDFTTEKLDFDMEHPVDIITQDAYDGGVNLIINDGKNVPRLINQRFSVQDENTFKVTNHSGFKDTNIYDEETFSVDTSLKQIPLKIPELSYEGLIDNGKLPCGSYTFYFKLSDTDGNESEVICESGIVQCHIGNINDPHSIRMGMQDENSNKCVKFKLSNIDSGFDYIHVLYSRTSSGNDQAAVTSYYKINQNYSVNVDGVCDITINGAEITTQISSEELYVDYADINSAKTQTVSNNVLLLGNVDTPEHDWDAIKRFTWKIIPRWKQCNAGEIGQLDYKYEQPAMSKSKTNEFGFCYYNTKNIYYRLGYWPDEIYRFGIVYIFEDNSLSPVINLQGIDFNTVNVKEHVVVGDDFPELDDYESLFFAQDTTNINRNPEHLYEEDDLYFNKKYKLNSRGVIKFPKKNTNGNIDVINIIDGVMNPKPLYINFDLSYIGYKYAKKNKGDGEVSSWNEGDCTNWKDVLKKHKIKGFFFVRQKRIPTILGQGLIIGHTDKDRGSLPFIKNGSNYVTQPFIGEDRLLHEDAIDQIFSGSQFDNNAMLFPDAEISEATFNQLFTSSKFTMQLNGICRFNYNSEDYTANVKSFTLTQNDTTYLSKLTNVPENTHTITDGTNYFSTVAGNAMEAHKTVDCVKQWRWTIPQELTVSTSLLRGQWGPYVGLSNPDGYEQSPYSYGSLYTIKKESYTNEESATELDFQKVLYSNEPFYAVTHRMNLTEKVDCFRGDCYISMFTHRMFRNFIDDELPTNHQIIDPACWQKNYGVRCTAEILSDATSNLEKESEGWYIGDSENYKKSATIQAVVALLTGNVLGFIATMIQYSVKVKKDQEYTEDAIKLNYKNGFANEIVQAFEVYTGGVASNTESNLNEKGKDSDGSPKSISWKLKKHSYEIIDGNHKWIEPHKKKLAPKEQESTGGINLKAIFKSDDDWELRGISQINRADVNAVAMGQWITFPICSNKNLAFRDVDFSNATEEAMFNRKRSFYPLSPKIKQVTQRDSNVINQASSISLPSRAYYQLPSIPFYKQEYFTRINNSFMQVNGEISNKFKLILETAYRDYDKQYGGLTKIESVGNYVYLIFKHGIGIIDFYSSVTQAQDARGFLPEMQVISNKFGTIWKDSVLLTPDGTLYGLDSVAKCIWRIHGTEINCISDMKVGKFLIDNLDMSEFTFRPYIGHINIKTHYNAFKHDVIFTYYNDKLYSVPSIYSDNKYSVDEQGYVIDIQTQERIYENKKLVKGTQLLSNYDKETQDWKSYSELIDELPSTECHKWAKGTNWSLCFNEDLQEFQTFYDWVPLESANIDNIWFSFDKDDIDKVKNDIINEQQSSQKINVTFEQKFVTTGSNKVVSFDSKITNVLTSQVYRKNTIDPAFINDTWVYYIKKVYQSNTYYSGTTNKVVEDFYTKFNTITLLPNKTGIIRFYLKFTSNNSELNLSVSCNNNNNNVGNKNEKIISKNTDWMFIEIFIKNDTTEDLKFDVQLSNVNQEQFVDYMLCEPMFIETDNIKTDIYGSGNIGIQKLEKNSYGLFTEDYDIRNTDKYSIKLWKHGQAGVYDNQGKILPCNWYGKQHEFNFEFVVNETAQIQKIFNNLKIISNKAEPYKFEYEVVGEGYDWYKYKEIVYWINNKVKSGKFKDLNEGYIYVLKNDLNTIYQSCSDFPRLFNKELTYKIPKLPYFEIKLADKKGLPEKDKSYTKNDIWSGLNDTYDKQYDNRPNNYKYNTSDAIIVEDQQLNEYRVHTESYGNDMKKYGRVRGNMEYLEDLWNIEIRPIPVKYVYYDKDTEKLESKLTETRHRDKYIKIKVRYTGEDLAIIQGIQTMYDYSFA